MKAYIKKVVRILKCLEKITIVFLVIGSIHLISILDQKAISFTVNGYYSLKDRVKNISAVMFDLQPITLEQNVVAPQSLVEYANTVALDENILPQFFRAIIKSESNWNVNAKNVTKTGDKAIGLGQILLSNTGPGKICFEIKNEKEAYDPIKNLKCAAKIVRHNLDLYKGDSTKAIRQYKASVSCINGGCADVEIQVAEVFETIGRETPASL